MDTIRLKCEREAKNNLEKDGGEGKKQGGVEQSGGTEQGVLVGKRDGLMRLLARRDMMMITSMSELMDTQLTYKNFRRE